jgi:hypothetical protein
LHELVDLDGLIVVVVQDKAYLRDVLDVSDFVAIEKEQKFDQLIHRKVQVILGQCHKSQYEAMLLLDFVKDDVFASRLSDLVVDDCPRNRSEEEHVEENKYYVENVVRLVVLDC